MKPNEISDMASKIIGNGRTTQNEQVDADEYDKGDADFACPACGAQISVKSNPPKEEP